MRNFWCLLSRPRSLLFDTPKGWSTGGEFPGGKFGSKTRHGRRRNECYPPGLQAHSQEEMCWDRATGTENNFLKEFLASATVANLWDCTKYLLQIKSIVIDNVTNLNDLLHLLFWTIIPYIRLTEWNYLSIVYFNINVMMKAWV